MATIVPIVAWWLPGGDKVARVLWRSAGWPLDEILQRMRLAAVGAVPGAGQYRYWIWVSVGSPAHLAGGLV